MKPGVENYIKLTSVIFASRSYFLLLCVHILSTPHSPPLFLIQSHICSFVRSFRHSDIQTFRHSHIHTFINSRLRKEKKKRLNLLPSVISHSNDCHFVSTNTYNPASVSCDDTSRSIHTNCAPNDSSHHQH